MENTNWLCPACGQANPSESTVCSQCGCPSAATEHEIAQYKKIAQNVASSAPQSNTVNNTGSVKEYFTVSTYKLVLMCVFTFSLYEIYWFYKNWTAIKQHYTGSKIMPAARSLFAPIWAYSCFKQIKNSAAGMPAYKDFPIGNLALAFFTFNLCSGLPPPLNFLGLLTFYPIIAVNNMALAVNRRNNPDFKNNEEITTNNKIVIAIGAFFWVMVIVGMLIDAHYLPGR
ncbi:MAG TPA: Ran-binding zinc finger domain-containing protein [Methylophilaceae bacterium]|jgi:hypothetical protein